MSSFRQKITIELDLDNTNSGKHTLEVFNKCLSKIREIIESNNSNTFYTGRVDVYTCYYMDVDLRLNVNTNTIEHRTEKEYKFDNSLEMIDWIKLNVEGESTKFMLMERGLKNNNSFKF